jgi:hypothetical protein
MATRPTDLINLYLKGPSFLYVIAMLLTCCFEEATAQNPFVVDQFTADPSARVFEGRIYVYPSHDIPCTEGKGRIGWFCMEDYHVFSSDNFLDWKDHGVILRQNEIPWVKPNNYAMWAPDCIYKDGKYFFYFPTFPKDTTRIKGFTIGVAVSDHPAGPFVPQAEPIANVRGIDPNVFIDKNGAAYLYWSQGHIYGAKLKDNMLELATEPKILGDLPDKGLKEGPYVIERNGVYYLTYPHVQNKTERLEYAIGDNPLGPFKVAGVLMDESPTGCWTNHHSFIELKGQWYLFYHHNDLSPKFDKNRSIRVDSLFFNADGTIRKVKPTLRGVANVPASRQLHIDRYSAISTEGASVSFVDSTRVDEGWKVTLDGPRAWVQFNAISFDKSKYKTVNARVRSVGGGGLKLLLDSRTGSDLATLTVASTGEWTTVSSRISKSPKNVHNLFVMPKDNATVEVDWIRFE